MSSFYSHVSSFQSRFEQHNHSKKDMINLNLQIHTPPTIQRRTRTQNPFEDLSLHITSPTTVAIASNDALWKRIPRDSLSNADLIDAKVSPQQLIISKRTRQQSTQQSSNKDNALSPSGRGVKKKRKTNRFNRPVTSPKTTTMFPSRMLLKREDIAMLTSDADSLHDFVQLELHILDEARRRRQHLILPLQSGLSLENAPPATTMLNQFKHLSLQPDCLVLISDASFQRIYHNYKLAKDNVLKMNVFKPLNGQFLVHWLNDAENRANQLIPNPIMERGFNEQPKVKIEAAAMMRHILIQFQPSAKKFPALLNCFAVLLIGRTLRDDEFPSRKTIMDHMLVLHKLEWKQFCIEFEPKIQRCTKHNFKRLWYSISDDSKHHRVDRHILLMSSLDADDLPIFKLLTAAMSASKDSAGNADANVYSFMENLTPAILAHYGGSCTDNASDALKECRLTFDSILESIPNHKRSLYGYIRKIVQLGDPFHIDNIVVNLISKRAFGQLEQDNHRQNHHLQLCQNLYDFVSKNKVLSQNVMNDLLKDTNLTKVKVNPKRQRDQRWLANQRNCLWIRRTMEMKTTAGEPVLLQWSMEIAKQKLTSLGRTIIEDTIRQLMLPSIMVAIYFEADVGQYFEITSFWHALCGQSQRPGFRMMDIHSLYIDYCVPFWNKAMVTPELVFSKTFDYMATIEDEVSSVVDLKKNQIRYSIEFGKMKLIEKLSEFLFVPPLCYLLLLNQNVGAKVFRAMMPILSSKYDMAGGNWGTYNDNDNTENAWNCLFTIHQDNIVHFFGQLGFARPWDYSGNESVPALRIELMHLSRYSCPPSTSRYPQRNSSTPKERYPIIYELLDAAFGLYPSNSRIGEQGHGRLRYCNTGSETFWRSDATLSYMFDFYVENDKNRKILHAKQKLIKKNELFEGVRQSTDAITGTSMFDTKEACIMHAESARTISKKYNLMRREVRAQVQVKRDVILDGGLQAKNTVISEKLIAKLNEARGRMRSRPKSTKEDFSDDVMDAVIVYDSNFERDATMREFVGMSWTD